MSWVKNASLTPQSARRNRMRRQPRYTRTSPAAEGRDRDWTYTAPRPDTIGEIEQKNSSRDLTQGRALPRDLSEHRVEEPGRARSGGRHQNRLRRNQQRLKPNWRRTKTRSARTRDNKKILKQHGPASLKSKIRFWRATQTRGQSECRPRKYQNFVWQQTQHSSKSRTIISTQLSTRPRTMFSR
jgi:hypothetical protein